MGEIKSNAVTAQGAISQLVGVDVASMQNQSVEFSYSSGIEGMEKAKETTNRMLQAISSFTEATLKQANKFPEIAEKIAKRDIEESKRWEKIDGKG